MGVEETRFIRTTEAPRWRQNAGDACLTIEEYYDKILDMVRVYKQRPHKMVVDFWQTVMLFPKEKGYTIRPAMRHESLCTDSYPICLLNRHRIGIADAPLHPNLHILRCGQVLHSSFCERISLKDMFLKLLNSSPLKASIP